MFWIIYTNFTILIFSKSSKLWLFKHWFTFSICWSILGLSRPNKKTIILPRWSIPSCYPEHKSCAFQILMKYHASPLHHRWLVQPNDPDQRIRIGLKRAKKIMPCNKSPDTCRSIYTINLRPARWSSAGLPECSFYCNPKSIKYLMRFAL